MLKDRSGGMGQPLSPSDPAWPGHYIVPANNRCRGNARQVDTLILPDSLLEGGGDINQFQNFATN